MDYEKKYRDLVEAVKELQEANPSDEGIQKWVKDNVPELKESEDERIRKLLVEAVIQVLQDQYCSNRGVSKEKVIAWLEKQGGQESVWSEEDERKSQLLTLMCDDTKGDSATYSTMYREMEELKTWLKSLKDRVQPKQEWSEEDEERRLDVIKYLELFDAQGIHGNVVEPCINWLKSLKDRIRKCK